MRFLGGLLARCLLVAAAVGAAQFPVYFLAYGNALAGARAEAELRYRQLQQEAAQTALPVEAFIRKHEDAADSVFRASGRIHRTTQQRYAQLSADDEALRGAEVWERPLVLMRHFDPALHAALRFEPGLAFTAESGVYALAGLLLAWLLTAALGLLFRRDS